MNRVFGAVLFLILSLGLTFFFWQRQFGNYNFSLDKEKKALSAFSETAKEHKKSLPKFDISDEFIKKFEKFRQEKYATSTEIESILDELFSTSTLEEL